jgi:hypothetical protein
MAFIGLGHISEVKFAAGGIVPIRGTHLVIFIHYCLSNYKESMCSVDIYQYW